METFGFVSGVASILGLIASTWALVEVVRLRRRYWRMSVLPGLIHSLGRHELALTAAINMIGGAPAAADSVIAELRATLDQLSRGVAGRNKTRVDDVRRMIANTWPGRTKSQVQAIRSQVTGLIQYLFHLVEEDPWT